jgi:ribosome-associated toxin RatA of RatAB toxin-antitoxin module
MVNISQTALLPYSAERMFALVNDIAAYPLFMQGCLGAEVLETEGQTVIARLELGKAGLRHAFTTRNTLQAPVQMDMALVDGPFKVFSAQWRFIPLTDSACKVCLDMHFEFRLGLVDAALSSLFEATSRDLVNAVCKRAEFLYGKK